ncbi:MAG TPA: permease, partial [Pirellulales bacterium]|nr:permease [Pirellulales bacterium]
MSWFTFNFNDFSYAFLSVLFEGVPFLLAGSLLSGVVDVFVSSERLERILPKNPTAAILLSGFLGTIFPMCECGNVILIRRFIRKGLPLSCAVTYMLSAPIVSPLVALSTWTAFHGRKPWEMTSLRMGIGYFIAVVAGVIVQQLRASSILRPEMMQENAPAAAPRKRLGLKIAANPTAEEAKKRDFAEIAVGASVGQKVLLAIQSATADFLDVAFFFIVGISIASLFNTAVNQQVIQRFATQQPLAIIVLMILAALIALCSTTSAFVAASFSLFPASAKLAFLVFGPVFDLKLFWLYGLVFRRRFVVILPICLF